MVAPGSLHAREDLHDHQGERDEVEEGRDAACAGAPFIRSSASAPNIGPHHQEAPRKQAETPLVGQLLCRDGRH
jgi:hypothetical protein